jgi:hypothetical protein
MVSNVVACSHAFIWVEGFTTGANGQTNFWATFDFINGVPNIGKTH